MLKDIIVHIPVDRPAEPVIDCAVSIAKIFGAHLEGLVCTYQIINAGIAVGASAASFALPTEYNTDPELANQRLEKFMEAAGQARITASTGCVSDTPFQANQRLAEFSRLFDLSVVAQPDFAKPTYDGPLPEAILFGSGRPMLMVPYIHKGVLKTDRALICWDGGHEAARAVRDALPLLRKAKAIDIVTVNGRDSSDTSAAALVVHLARHGLQAVHQQSSADTSNIHNAILSLAADNGSDLLIMGGYGHSRVREFILGGVTRGMFESLTIPALISH